MGGFSNPIVAGNNLQTSRIQSPDFVQGKSGWAIKRDGTAYFTGLNVTNTITTGGSIILTSTTDGMFIYNGTPAAGNLIVSITAASGTDSFGNTYPAGVQVKQGFGAIDGSVIDAGTLTGGALAPNTITATQIANQTITATEIANSAIGASQLAAGAVYPGALQTGAVTANAIAANAITAGAIAAGALDAFAINTGVLTVQGSQGAILIYNGSAGSGRLFISLAPQAGIDSYGNSFPAGIAVTNNGTITGADLIIQPSQGGLFGYSQ